MNIRLPSGVDAVHDRCRDIKRCRRDVVPQGEGRAAGGVRRGAAGGRDAGRRRLPGGRAAAAPAGRRLGAAPRAAARRRRSRRSRWPSVDAAFDHIAALSGSGSAAARRAAVDELFGRATEAEQAFLRALITGELRQGALRAVTADAIAAAFGLKQADVRRALMLLGDPGEVAAIAREGGAEALRRGRAAGRPAGAADAGGHRARPGRCARQDAAGRRRVEAGRRPHPGAPRRRRGRRLHAQPGRRHQPRAGDRRAGAGAARDARSCWTARRSCCARTAGRSPSR